MITITSEAIANLRKAGKLIHDEGWTTGTMYRQGVGYCAIGAISKVATGGVYLLGDDAPTLAGVGQPAFDAVSLLVAFLHEHPDNWEFQDVEGEWDVLQYPLDSAMTWNDEFASNLEARGGQVVERAMLAAADWAEREAAADA
jgi:hypothetical protein